MENLYALTLSHGYISGQLLQQSRRLDLKKMFPSLFRFLTKVLAGETGICLNSCMYCCQGPHCPPTGTKNKQYGHSTSNGMKEGVGRAPILFSLIALLSFAGVLIKIKTSAMAKSLNSRLVTTKLGS